MDWSIFISVLAALAVWSAPQCLYDIYLGYIGAVPKSAEPPPPTSVFMTNGIGQSRAEAALNAKYGC